MEGNIDLDCGTTFVAHVGPRQALQGEDVYEHWLDHGNYDDFLRARVLYCPDCREADFLFGDRYDP